MSLCFIEQWPTSAFDLRSVHKNETIIRYSWKMTRLLKTSGDWSFIWALQFSLKRGRKLVRFVCLLWEVGSLAGRSYIYQYHARGHTVGNVQASANPLDFPHLKLESTNSQLLRGFLYVLASMRKPGPLYGKHFSLKYFIVGMCSSNKVFTICGGWAGKREGGVQEGQQCCIYTRGGTEKTVKAVIASAWPIVTPPWRWRWNLKCSRSMRPCPQTHPLARLHHMRASTQLWFTRAGTWRPPMWDFQK